MMLYRYVTLDLPSGAKHQDFKFVTTWIKIGTGYQIDLGDFEQNMRYEYALCILS